MIRRNLTVILYIAIDERGNITSVMNRGFRQLESQNLDEEAIAYDKENHNIYIGKEKTSEIVRYDLLGRKANAKTKGIVVVNGKKVVK